MKFDVVGVAATALTAMAAELALDATFEMPGRVYLSGGPIAYDCESLIVWAARVPPAGGGLGLVTREDVMYVVELNVTVLRCVPPELQDVEPAPAAPNLDAFGRLILGDGGSLLRAAWAARLSRTLAPACDDVGIGPVLFEEPQGFMTGTTLSLSIQI